MDYTKLLTCYVPLLSAIINTDAARILAVFPTPSISHQFVFRPLTQELARRGHEVTVITTDIAFPKGQASANLTEVDLHDVSYAIWTDELSKVAVGNDNDIVAQLKMFITLFSVILERQLQIPEIQNIINNDTMKFDLLLIEACVRPALIFSHIFKAPVILLSSFGPMVDSYAIVGAPSHPIYQPIITRQKLYNLTMWERIYEVYQQFNFEYVYYENERIENMMLGRLFGPDTPTLGELKNNVAMVFVNVHPIWTDNTPVPPNFIYMGGIHQKATKELPKDLKSYLDSSKHGVIYLSFGTNVHSSVVPPQTTKIMMKVFSELPYDVIWRWDSDLHNKPANIKVVKWVPQSDILHHPKVKLFITQGGLQSTDEAITAGVPLIGIPVIADQWYNVVKYVHHGIGMQLEMGAFTEEDFRVTVMAVIDNPSYRNNIIRLRTIMRDQPQSPLERAIWWTEHVLRHGGARHLRSPTSNMSRTEYFELKLIFILVTCSFAAVITLLITLYYFKRYILSNNLPSVKRKCL